MGMLEDDLSQFPPNYGKAKPLDTAELGPVRFDPNSRAEQAAVVRRALEAVAKHTWNLNLGRKDDYSVKALRDLAIYASDETLLKLWRQLK